jgi:MYXO-CTERM domain-containing protein
MYRIPALAGVLLLTASSFAQPPDATQNPTPETYPQTTYNRSGESAPGAGNWGLLGLLGLAGLLGLRRRETIVQSRTDYEADQRRWAS